MSHVINAHVACRIKKKWYVTVSTFGVNTPNLSFSHQVFITVTNPKF